MKSVFVCVATAMLTMGSASAENDLATLSTPMLIEASAAPSVRLDGTGSTLGALSLVFYAIAGFAFALRQGRSSS